MSEGTSSLLEGLTTAQAAAVEHFEGPLLILAGPGSGKTRVVSRRVARLIERGVHPSEILAITFTNKAAREMAERVAHLVPGARVQVSTFHRFCARLLRQYGGALGLKSNFSIFDTGDQHLVLKEAVHDEGFDTTHYSPSRIGWRISQLKNDCILPEAFQKTVGERIGNHLDAVVAKVYPRYEARLLKANAVDFDDLLLHVVRLLHEYPDLRELLDRRFRYVLVDEYQDTNRAQYQIVAALSQNARNLCATGDPDQSIYGWRGARIENILKFERDYPEVRVLRLEQNFRSTPQILKVADELISHNTQRKHKKLVPFHADGAEVEIRQYQNTSTEASAIAEEIRDKVNRGDFRHSDFAVLYRTNSLSRSLEIALVRAGVPFKIAGGVAFYERTEVKDLLAYLRLIENPDDIQAFRRVLNVPARGIGKTSREKLERFATANRMTLLEAAGAITEGAGITKKAANAIHHFAALIDDLATLATGPVHELIRAIVSRTGYVLALGDAGSEDVMARQGNIDELINSAVQYDSSEEGERSLQGFLESASLAQDTDSLEEQTGSVTLMTLHAAKGLEFPVVYIVGVEHGLLPHERSIREGDPLQIEEERRLLFVGMTRARKELVLTWTRQRLMHGREMYSIASQFLSEISGRRLDLTDVRATSYDRYDDARGGTTGDSVLTLFQKHANRAARREAEREARRNEATAESETAQIEQPAPSPSPATGSLFPASALVEDVPGDTDDNSDEPASFMDQAIASPLKDVGSKRKIPSRRKEKPAPAAPPTLDQLRGQMLKGTDLKRGDEILANYRIGQNVAHPEYGEGRIVGLTVMNSRPTIQVEFTAGKVQSFVATKAPLTILP